MGALRSAIYVFHLKWGRSSVVFPLIMEAELAAFRNSEGMFPHSSPSRLPPHTSLEMMICQNVFSRFAVVTAKILRSSVPYSVGPYTHVMCEDCEVRAPRHLVTDF